MYLDWHVPVQCVAREELNKKRVFLAVCIQNVLAGTVRKHQV